MRAVVIALVSLVVFAGIGAATVVLLPSADSAPLHPIEVNAPTIEPIAPAPSPPAPAAVMPPAPPPPAAPVPAPRTQAGLRDVPEPPPPLVSGDNGDDNGDDDRDDDSDFDDDGDDDDD